MKPRFLRVSLAASPLYGILLTCIAVTLFASHDSFVKYLGTIYPLVMIVWVRFVSQSLFLTIAFMPKLGKRLLFTRHPWLQAMRAFCLIATSLCFVSGLRYLPLAEMSALHFVSPLLLVMISSLALKEQVHTGQWLAVLGGFCGVLIVMRPGGDVFSPAVLFPLGSATFFALYQLITRTLCRTEEVASCNFITGLCNSLVMTILLPFFWQTPSWQDLILMLIMGLCGTGGHMLMSWSYRFASPATLAPFTYGQVVCAGFLGWQVFRQIPDNWTLLGIIIICGSGLAVVLSQYHQRRARRRFPGQEGVSLK